MLVCELLPLRNAKTGFPTVALCAESVAARIHISAYDLSYLSGQDESNGGETASGPTRGRVVGRQSPNEHDRGGNCGRWRNALSGGSQDPADPAVRLQVEARIGQFHRSNDVNSVIHRCKRLERRSVPRPPVPLQCRPVASPSGQRTDTTARQRHERIRQAYRAELRRPGGVLRRPISPRIDGAVSTRRENPAQHGRESHCWRSPPITEPEGRYTPYYDI